MQIMPMMAPAAQTKEVISFGPFPLVPTERLLIRDGTPVAVSTRAFVILMTLLGRSGEIVSKSDLVTHITRNIVLIWRRAGTELDGIPPAMN